MLLCSQILSYLPIRNEGKLCLEEGFSPDSLVTKTYAALEEKGWWDQLCLSVNATSEPRGLMWLLSAGAGRLSGLDTDLKGKTERCDVYLRHLCNH